MTRLGVNIDHVATVRQARQETFPDPVEAAVQAVKAGADGITAHLREDRRHIQDNDLFRMKKVLKAPLNMEMSVAPAIVKVAERLRPQWICLVPERRQELTTEGGLDVIKGRKAVAQALNRLKPRGTQVSLFIDSDLKMIETAARLGADAVEIHTGRFARLFEKGGQNLKNEKARIQKAARRAAELGLIVNAGHGLTYENTPDLLKLYPFHELNIGFSIIAQSVFTGLPDAVRKMKKVIKLCAVS